MSHNSKILKKIEEDMKDFIQQSRIKSKRLDENFNPNLSNLLVDDLESFKKTLTKKDTAFNQKIVIKNETKKEMAAPIKALSKPKVIHSDNKKKIEKPIKIETKKIAEKTGEDKKIKSNKEVLVDVKSEQSDVLDLDFENLFDFEKEKKEISALINKNNQTIQKQKERLQNKSIQIKEKTKKDKKKNSQSTIKNKVEVMDNFFYVKEKNERLYTLLKQAESLRITNHIQAAQIAFRDGLANFMTEMIKESGNEKAFQSFFEKKEQRKFVSVEASRDLIKCFFIENNHLLGKDFYYSNKKNKREGLSFNDLRELGNLSSHPENLKDEKNKNFVVQKNGKTMISSEVLNQAFFTFNQAMQAFYQISVPYDEDFLKIGNFDIYQCIESASGKEYYGINQETKPSIYAIIRRYNNQNADLNFLERNVDTLTRIDQNTFERISGIAEIKQLNTVNTEDEDYYLAYLFRREPLLLNQTSLKKIDTQEKKLEFCLRISKAMDQLHNLPEPIYHRMLNPNAIILEDFSDLGKGYMPFLINFNFSKFKDADSNRTVVQHLNEAVESMKNQDVKNLAYICAYDTSDSSYEKMDIYAMGVLFEHILLGDLDQETSLDQIEKQYGTELADLLELMINEDASYRPKAHDVFKVFDAAYKKINAEPVESPIIVSEGELKENDEFLNLDVKSMFDFEKEKEELEKSMKEVEKPSVIKEKTNESKPIDDPIELKKLHIQPLEKREETEGKEAIVKEKPNLSNRVESNTIQVFDNFAYLKDKNKMLYSHIKEAESELINKHTDVAKTLSRDILDPFLDEIINENHLKDEVIAFQNDSNEKKGFPSVNSLNQVNINIKIKLMHNHKIISNKMKDCAHNIRLLGNDGSHSGGTAKIERAKIISGFKNFKKISCSYYGVKNEPINEDYFKIAGYDIYKVLEKSDTERTGCIREYYGVKEGRASKEYAIIRRYKKQNMDAELIQRNISTLEQINLNTIDGIRGIAQVQQLNKLDTFDEDYYVAYIFHRQPFGLIQDNLKKVETEFEKIQMCYRISETMDKLHTLAQPIYHRMINPNAIVLCDYGDKGYIPFLVGFDFSKFENQNNFKTVIQSWQQALNSMKDTFDYICDEDPANTSYEKLDIYALGVLFMRILCGDLKKDINSAFDCIDENYTEEIADILDAMTSPELDRRPNAHAVFTIFEKAYKEYQ